MARFSALVLLAATAFAQQCRDYPAGWTNTAGFDCNAFRSTRGACRLYGGRFASDGYTGNTACCACDGGVVDEKACSGFGIRDTNEICENTSSICEAHFETTNDSCDKFCSDNGMVCVDAWNESAGSGVGGWFNNILGRGGQPSCDKGENVGCKSTGLDDQICRCKKPVAKPTKNLVEVLTGLGLNALIKAVTDADLVAAVNTAAPKTVLAPTDAAFTALFDALGAASVKLLPAEIKNVLLYHVIGTQYKSTDLPAGDTKVDTLLAGRQVTAVNNNGVFFKDESGSPPTPVVQADALATNGVVHVLDAVLVPDLDAANAGDLAAALGDLGFSTLVDLAVQTQIASSLQGEAETCTDLEHPVDGGTWYDSTTFCPGSPGDRCDCAGYTDGRDNYCAQSELPANESWAAHGVPAFKACCKCGGGNKQDKRLTVLAPTNDAFAALLATDEGKAVANDPKLLKEALLYHVMAGQLLAADIPQGTSAVATLNNGQTLTVSNTAAGVFFTDERGNRAQVVRTDRLAKNGVIHALDRVLVPFPPPPPTQTIVEIASATAELSTLVSLVGQAGLVTALQPTFSQLDGTDCNANMGLDLKCDGWSSEAELKEACIRNVECTAYTLWNGRPWCGKKGAITKIPDASHQCFVKSDKLTVLAPTDDAFAALLATADGKKVANDPTALRNALLYHVFNGEVLSSAVPAGTGELPSLFNGEKVAYTNDAAGISFAGSVGGNGMVVTKDVRATNGVIHIINEVLIPDLGINEPPQPDKDIVELVVADPDLSTLLKLVGDANLAAALKMASPRKTVLAPSNAAFTKLFDQLDKLGVTLDAAQLRQTLLYHVLGSEIFAADIKSGDTDVDTLLFVGFGNTEKVTAQRDAAGVRFLGAGGGTGFVTRPDIKATNGVIHVIDEVLIPDLLGLGGPQEDLVGVIQGQADLSTLLKLAGDAGLASALQTASPKKTVLAPSNAAFTALFAQLKARGVTLDAAQTRQVVLYHVFESQILSSEIPAGETKLVTLLAGESVLAVNDAKGVRFESAGGSTGAVVAKDLLATNGVVHIIDQVLIPDFLKEPAQGLVEVVTDLGLTSLLDAVVNTGLASAVAAATPRKTILAPSNAAFANTLAALAAKGVTLTNDQLKEVLLYHVIGSEVFAADIAVGTTQIETLSKQMVSVTKDDKGSVYFEGVGGGRAMVVTADQAASNGVVHVIDDVLIPDLPAAPVDPADVAKADSLQCAVDANATKLQNLKAGMLDFIATECMANSNEIHCLLAQTILQQLL